MGEGKCPSPRPPSSDGHAFTGLTEPAHEGAVISSQNWKIQFQEERKDRLRCCTTSWNNFWMDLFYRRYYRCSKSLFANFELWILNYTPIFLQQCVSFSAHFLFVFLFDQSGGNIQKLSSIQIHQRDFRFREKVVLTKSFNSISFKMQMHFQFIFMNHSD